MLKEPKVYVDARGYYTKGYINWLIQKNVWNAQNAHGYDWWRKFGNTWYAHVGDTNSKESAVTEARKVQHMGGLMRVVPGKLFGRKVYRLFFNPNGIYKVYTHVSGY